MSIPILIIYIFAFSTILSLSCRKSEWIEPFPIRMQITILDSINVELGDSSIILGSIADAEVSAASGVFVLDKSFCCVRQFSLIGDYLTTLSRRGNGPGEIQNPVEITVMNNGNIVISDHGKFGLVIIDKNGESISEHCEWPLFPPEGITAVDSETIAGFEMSLNEHGTQFMAVFNLNLYSTTDATKLIALHSDSELVSLEQVAFSLLGINNFVVITSDRQGRVFYSRSLYEKYEILCWDHCGEVLFTAGLNMPPVEKSENDLREDTDYIRVRLTESGSGIPADGFKPDSHYRLVEGLGCDSLGNLWVQRGTENRSVFDVFNQVGEHVGTAEFPFEGRFWRFSITPYGSIAWNLDPESGIQNVYILGLPSSFE